ncbi:deoxyribonuclease IV [Mesoplasma lactucae]|uniref:Probable endonuclease 4 n=1 Tax=Mesoplasma lactucae ATCC 49193 TaxID=81460 RepID=A0A291IRM3_9MOLU|nr:deoxyribonuclease IV [Mesoplasma lactucae]ATG97394.1 deoxyribonuclease IV [Mesoplasma lactucae ATCC 49193]ATZ20153.1 endonuclease IV [Mesoplasma lactucae ATCC 49193]MCL8216902.1 putative endonuclease 4 [Mesoplasma lactucae ATCC 49193]
MSEINYPLLGSYVPMSKSTDYLVGAVKIAESEDANCFMFYTGAPQNTKRVPVSELEVPEFRTDIANSDINLNTVAIHAPYVVNLGNSLKAHTFDFGVQFLSQELQRASEIGVSLVVLHPGSAVGATVQQGLDQLVKGLDDIIATKPKGIKICLETMAGKGTELGVNFQELAYVIKNVKDSSDLGVCMDTCHVFDSGYDIKNNWDGVKEEFNKEIGFDKLWCMHINDSKNGLDSGSDRHANIGYGQIGFDALCKIVWDEQFKNVPKYLETPLVEGVAPYKYEIKMLRDKKFTDFVKTIEESL